MSQRLEITVTRNRETQETRAILNLPLSYAQGLRDDLERLSSPSEGTHAIHSALRGVLGGQTGGAH